MCQLIKSKKCTLQRESEVRVFALLPPKSMFLVKINNICVRTCSLAAKALDQKMRSAKRSVRSQTSYFFKLFRFLDFEKRGDVFRIGSRLVKAHVIAH